MSRCRQLLQSRTTSGNTLPPLSPIKHDELHREFLVCVKLSQQQYFATEIYNLTHNQPVAAGSAFASLDPYLDDTQVIRVGGRLENTLLTTEEKHPVILNGRCHLATLVIDWAHQSALHSGFNLTYTHAIKRAWIVGVRIKAFLRRCVVYANTRTRPMTQIMAQLPAARVTPSRPFSRTGVDYAGPFHVLRSSGRGIKSSKGYIAVFTCLATKAIHLELVGDLTTDSFLGALARFSGCRGCPHEIWSDNATNFRGADAELRRLMQAAELDMSSVEGFLVLEDITWRFIPQLAPHFGGLWEAAVRSTKIRLRRIAGPRKLTFEQFSTILVEIEMVLNSRPLVPLSGDTEDLNALTPLHFLIGEPLTSIPQPNVGDSNFDQLSHWCLVRGLRDHFWNRWSREYLNTLQQRSKLTRRQDNLLIDELVMIIDPSLIRPSGRWPLGRVLQVHPGSDGLVRAATIKTADNQYMRPVTKLIRLPVSSQSHRDSLRTSDAQDKRLSTAGGADTVFFVLGFPLKFSFSFIVSVLS